MLNIVGASAMRPFFPMFLVLAAGAQILAADTLLVSASGTYSSSTPVSFFTAPDATWSLSFVIQNNPSVSNASFGAGFSPSFTDFSYSLNGSPLAITPDDVRFWHVPVNTPFILGLSICWNSSCVGGTDEGIAFDTSQLYSGSELSPAIVPGVYATSEFFIDDGPSFGEPNTVLTISPEPSTLLLSAMGLGILAAVARGRALERRFQQLLRRE